MLNPQTVAVNFTVICNPFVANKVTAIVTGESLNAKKIDFTDEYNPSTKRLVTTLQPGMFYTFVFEKEGEPEEIVPTSPKIAGYGNPINPYQYFADPTAVEYDGRVKPVVGNIKWCGINLCEVLKAIVPKKYESFVKDHDFIELEYDDKYVYIDPTLYEFCGRTGRTECPKK